MYQASVVRTTGFEPATTPPDGVRYRAALRPEKQVANVKQIHSFGKVNGFLIDLQGR